MEKKTVRVPRISCGHCIKNIQSELGEIDGVKSVEGNVDSREVIVSWNPPATWETIARTLEEIGYPPEK
jgi:copper ion binding protein